MCGRVAISVSREDLMAYLYDYFSITNYNIDEFSPRYNISPSQNVLSIISDGVNNRAGFLKWGYVSPISKNETSNIIINSRAEGIDQKPTFSNSFINKRCIIPIDSFYEWKTENNIKTPMRIMMKDSSIFALAGIWTKTIKEDNSKLFTFSIITTQANSLIKEIHDRMPVILNQENLKLWLNPNNKDPRLLKSLLLPFDDAYMMAYPVSTEINNPKNDYPGLIAKK